jgi:hypothetical protein
MTTRRVCQSDPQRTDLSRQRSAQKGTYQAPGHKQTSRRHLDYVRFTPESGHCSAPLPCPLSANRDLTHCSKQHTT